MLNVTEHFATHPECVILKVKQSDAVNGSQLFPLSICLIDLHHLHTGNL